MNQLRNQPTHRTYFLLPAFIGLGTGLGALIGNIGVGMTIGVGVGTLLSLLGWLWEERMQD